MCGVILSAGASTRMGRDKALLPWPPAAPGSPLSGGETLLSAAIIALKPFTEAIVVVAGVNADIIAPIVTANGAALVRNSDPERGQFSSLQVGLREVLARGCAAAMIAASLKKLNASFDQALDLGKWGVAPEHNGKHGHPLLASRALIESFLAAPVASNAREVKRAHAQLIGYIPVPDTLVSVDVNTPEEYATLASTAAKPR